MRPLEDWYNQIPEQQRQCWTCHTLLSKKALQAYPHSDGWTVKGYLEKQWLYLHCYNCSYDTAIWKLGVMRE